MKKNLYLVQNTAGLSCIWLPTGDRKNPLTCVWVESKPQQALSTAESRTEAGRIPLCA